jgi:hypothetical protein
MSENVPGVVPMLSSGTDQRPWTGCRECSASRSVKGGWTKKGS